MSCNNQEIRGTLHKKICETLKGKTRENLILFKTERGAVRNKQRENSGGAQKLE